MDCQGTHRFFVAETYQVETEGTIGIIIVCTSCGESKLIPHKVAGASLSRGVDDRKHK